MVRAEYSEPDPFADLSYVKEPDRKPQRTTTVADVEVMLDTCEDHFRGVRDRAMIHVLASTGMRRAELARMMWATRRRHRRRKGAHDQER
jgi:site-specific recombinase XerD